MSVRTLLMVAAALFVSALCRTASLAQGGWDVWTVELRDGTRLAAAPVWSLDEKELRFGFDDGGEGRGTAVERPRLRLMSNVLRNSQYRADKGAGYVPPGLPKGDFDRDLVVLDDGRRIFGTVLIRAGNGKSGGADIYSPVLIQHGTEVSLTRVAYIKFATRLDKPKSNRPRRPRRGGVYRAVPETGRCPIRHELCPVLPGAVLFWRGIGMGASTEVWSENDTYVSLAIYPPTFVSLPPAQQPAESDINFRPELMLKRSAPTNPLALSNLRRKETNQ